MAGGCGKQDSVADSSPLISQIRGILVHLATDLQHRYILTPITLVTTENIYIQTSAHNVPTVYTNIHTAGVNQVATASISGDTACNFTL